MMEIKFADIAQIIVAIISFFGVVYSRRISVKKDPKKGSAPDSKNVSVFKRPVILTIVSVLLLIGNLGVFAWRTWNSSITEVKITDPVSGASVEMVEMVKGTSRNIPAGQSVWVIIYSHDVGRYYPQNDPAEMRADGGWDSRCSFGIESDNGRKFDAVAVLVNQEAREKFNSYLTQARNQKSWAGLEKLPDSAVIYDRLTVIRK